MHRFFLPPEHTQAAVLTLLPPEAHHAIRVLRVRPGERVTVLNGAGAVFLCRVQELTRQAVILIVEEKQAPPPPPYRLSLLQAIPKGKGMEAIVQKATELGVARIIPLLSERTSLPLTGGAAERKAGKWRATAREAIKQCGSPWLPVVEPPLTPARWLARGEKYDLSFIASLQPDGRHPRDYFRDFFERHKSPPRSVNVWVGPEGDFSPAEMQRAQAAGVLPITLGRLVLRCETAALYCLSVLNYELQAAPGNPAISGQSVSGTPA